VFIIGLEDGIFPISRSFESEKEIEEERRLLYVAMTRAQERLVLSYVNTRYFHGKRTPMRASRFIDEIDMNLPTKPKTLYQDSYSTNNYSQSYNSYSSGYTSSYNSLKTIKAQTQSTTFNNGYTRATNIEESPKAKNDTTKYSAGQIVKHPKFGKGQISAIVDNGVCAEIVFDDFGKKTLILEIAPLEILSE
jgi:DNA helicase-2/ATP-dependent DNA helicase PcrA